MDNEQVSKGLPLRERGKPSKIERLPQSQVGLDLYTKRYKENKVNKVTWARIIADLESC